MAKIKVKVQAKPGKTGTKIASGRVYIKAGEAKGKPLFQTRAQLNVHLSDKNGQPRPRHR